MTFLCPWSMSPFWYSCGQTLKMPPEETGSNYGVKEPSVTPGRIRVAVLQISRELMGAAILNKLRSWEDSFPSTHYHIISIEHC